MLFKKARTVQEGEVAQLGPPKHIRIVLGAAIFVGVVICFSYFVFFSVANPPVIKLPLDVVEPPRNVEASEWHSPYCGYWDDGCSECIRDAIQQEPHCVLKPVLPNQTCTKHAIICFREIDRTYFERICSRFFQETFLIVKNGDLVSTAYAMKVVWNKKNGQYISNVASLFDPSLLMGPIHFVVDRKGYVQLIALLNGEYSPVGTPFNRDRAGVRCTQTYNMGDIR